MNNKWILQDKIDQCFQNENHQASVLINLYKLVIPNWDNIRKLNGWPSINNHTWTYICQKFIEFDKIHHKDVLSGGLWMNSGFSIDNNLDNWEFSPIDQDKIIYNGMRNKITLITIDNFKPSNDTNNEISKVIRFHRLFDNNHSYYHCTRQSYKRLARLLNNHMLIQYNPSPNFKAIWKVL